MLRITVLDELETLKLEGRLTGPWVAELEKCWQRMTGAHRRPLTVDLEGVTFIDEAGKNLLEHMADQGAALKAAAPLTRCICDQIRERHRQFHTAVKALLGKREAIIVLFLPLLLLLSPVRLQAQAAPAPDTSAIRLTLRDAVQMALKQNPQVQIAVLNTAQAVEDRNIVRSALLPQVGGEAFWRYQRLNTAALIGGVSPTFPPVLGPFQIVQGGPVYSASIFDLTLWRRLQASQAGVRGSQAQQMGVREQIVLLTVSQYLGVLRASADVKAAQSRVDLAQALYNLAADLQKNGVGTGIDTLRANVQLQNERQRFIQADTARRTALFGLQRLLNLDPRRSIELSDEVSFFETPQIDANQALERAWETRPEMKALLARQQAADAAKRAAWEQRLPRFSSQGFWGYQGLTWGSSIPAYQVQITADMPIFAGGRIQAENTRASLELKKVEQERQDLRNVIALQVNTAMAELESARNEVEVANQGMNLAQQEVTQARDRFQAGVANNIEVITAQDEMARASDNQIAALYRYNQARADLAHAVGQMESLYSK